MGTADHVTSPDARQTRPSSDSSSTYIQIPPLAAPQTLLPKTRGLPWSRQPTPQALIAVILRHAPRARPLNVVRILLYIGSFDPLSVLDFPMPAFPLLTLALPSNDITSSSTLRLPSRSRIQSTYPPSIRTPILLSMPPHGSVAGKTDFTLFSFILTFPFTHSPCSVLVPTALDSPINTPSPGLAKARQ